MELEQIPISALQHWQYCPRQCGLIHLEQVFAENIHTQRGQAVHARVDVPGIEVRQGLRVQRALPIWSDTLGLIGKADVVEYLSDGTPYPVEYKQGSKHKAARIAECDDVQLTAQAVCLEEMSGHRVGEGAIFYASSKRRRTVAFNEHLRRLVALAVTAIRRMMESGRLPPPVNDDRCKHCSLVDLCQPALARPESSAVSQHIKLFDPEA